MLPVPHGCGGSPMQIGFGERESSNTIAAPASCGVAPTKAADLYSCVVPVLAAIGRFQPAAAAAAADVPPGWSSLDIPFIRVSASAGGTACVHGCDRTGTAAPERAVTETIGSGGHHMPWDASVASTFASSSALVGVTPSVNDAWFCDFV